MKTVRLSIHLRNKLNVLRRKETKLTKTECTNLQTLHAALSGNPLPPPEIFLFLDLSFGLMIKMVTNTVLLLFTSDYFSI